MWSGAPASTACSGVHRAAASAARPPPPPGAAAGRRADPRHAPRGLAARARGAAAHSPAAVGAAACASLACGRACARRARARRRLHQRRTGPTARLARAVTLPAGEAGAEVGLAAEEGVGRPAGWDDAWQSLAQEDLAGSAGDEDEAWDEEDESDEGEEEEGEEEPLAEATGEEGPVAVDPEEVIFGRRRPFSELDLRDEHLLAALPALGFRESTRVQAAAIPMILAEDRRAVVISAETGSGKTLAYLLPAFELALRREPRPEGCPCPTALILVPGRELGYQVALVAERIAAALAAAGGRRLSVHCSRRGWPERAPDILVTTPRAAAQGLLPCGDEDEVARREALARVRDVELLCLDEADLLLGGGSQGEDVRAVFVALSASYPNKPRQVLPEAQVFYRGGVPVEVLDEASLEWRPGHAQSNADGTFHVRFGPSNWERYVSRTRMRGPGIGMLVEHGPHVVMACATLPTFKRSRFFQGEQDNSLFNSGIGSPDWIIKRWFPNAIRIQSEWIHRRHPCIVQQHWVYIEGEARKGAVRLLPLRIEKMLEVLRSQDPAVRTLVFANTPDACLSAQLALRAEGIGCCGMHAGVPFEERLEGLKRFGRGEISVMICTDLAARGLDLPICRHVLQLEFARNTVDHLHRVGRAARAGRLSRTTNLWGDGDAPVRDAVIKAPAMGLNGEVLYRTGNRGRLRRTRKKQRRQEHAFAEVRKRSRLARARTQKG